jgi:predicted RNA-binding protein YlqC (UPF0109 family)
MEEFLTYLLSKIVDKPENILLERKEDNQSIIINLKVEKNDLSKVIGKNGRTIQAIRLLLQTYLLKEGSPIKKIFLNLGERKS